LKFGSDTEQKAASPLPPPRLATVLKIKFFCRMEILA